MFLICTVVIELMPLLSLSRLPGGFFPSSRHLFVFFVISLDLSLQLTNSVHITWLYKETSKVSETHSYKRAVYDTEVRPVPGVIHSPPPCVLLRKKGMAIHENVDARSLQGGSYIVSRDNNGVIIAAMCNDNGPLPLMELDEVSPVS
jgi:hypothetical protein